MKKISVIIPTHNRHQKLQETVQGLRNQTFLPEDYEIIVVDDGSTPPVSFAEDFIVSPEISILRLKGGERSLARNTGAEAARGELLIFVDDDISVNKEFLAAHWDIHQEFTDVLAVGKILLPDEYQNEPFVRFRQKLEKDGIPTKRGLIADENFCAAANTSISRKLFLDLSGFDLMISSSEDQDFALRHSAKGRKIVFVPEAVAIHRDNALDIRTYCRRNEWGSRLMLPFYQRYADFPQNIEREKVNGFIKWGNEPVLQSVRKFIKKVIAFRLSTNGLFIVSDVLEKISPHSKLLNRVYELLLGAHILRGYQAAMKEKDLETK